MQHQKNEVEVIITRSCAQDWTASLFLSLGPIPAGVGDAAGRTGAEQTEGV